MLTLNHSQFSHVEMYLLEKSEAVLPQLYLLHRGLAAFKTADQHFYSFNAENFQGDTVIMGDQTLHLAQIQRYVEGLCVTIKRDLDEILDGQFDLPDDAFIHDEPRTLTGEWGFLDHKQNPWNHQGTLLEHILNTPRLRSKYIYQNSQGSLVWNPANCHKLMRSIFDNNMLICLAMILTFGGLARGTELLSHLIRNIAAGSIRNVFALFNQLILRGSYNKTSNATSSDKTMARVPYPPIGRLAIRHLAYVRPLFCELQSVFRPGMLQNARHYLFAGLTRPVETRDLSRKLSRAFQSFGHTPGTSYGEVRQMVAFIMQCNQVVFQDDESTAAADQMGHSQVMHREHYGGDDRFPLSINDQVFQSTALISAKYQLLLGFPPTLLQAILGGRERQWEILRTVDAIRRGNYVAPGQELIQGQTGIVAVPNLTMPGITRELSEKLMPGIISALNQGISRATAVFANIAFPHHPSPLRTGGPIITRPPSLALLAKLREVLYIMGEVRPNRSFSDSAQAKVTQLMHEGECHVAYITRTSELPSLSRGRKLMFRRRWWQRRSGLGERPDGQGASEHRLAHPASLYAGAAHVTLSEARHGRRRVVVQYGCHDDAYQPPTNPRDDKV